MPEPLAVDIVVTSYDYARFLPAAIDSALAQDHPRSGSSSWTTARATRRRR